MKKLKNIKKKNNALFAGLFYLILAITGVFALMYALPQIIVEGHVTKTIVNINNNPFLFRMAIVSLLIMNMVSIVLAIYLYRLLSNINKTMAMSMLILLVFGACISAISEINHFAIIIVNNIEGFNAIEKLNHTELFIELHNHGTHIAVIFWGLWLFPLGALIFKLDTLISKIIGVLLIIAGMGYVIDSTFLFLYPQIKIPTFSDYMSYGEPIFIIWLLAKSKTIEQLALAKANLNNKIQNK